MDAANLMTSGGKYFVVRYRPNASRDETRNIGVALVDQDARFAAVKHLPPSQLASGLRHQGILDAALLGLSRRILRDPDHALAELSRLGEVLSGSILVGREMPADTGSNPTATLDALFRGLVAQRTGRRAGLPKAEMLDKVVDAFRQTGAPVSRGEYVGDFLLDAVVTPSNAPSTAVHVQSFAMARRDWARAERETGYFLYAMESLQTPGLCILQPPNEASDDDARTSFQRIARLTDRSGVQKYEFAELSRITRTFQPEEQLPLVMA
jgi:hypothetical protein